MFLNEQFTIKTSLSPDRACQKLMGVVEQPKPLRRLWDKSEKLSEGEIVEYLFRISRLLNYRSPRPLRRLGNISEKPYQGEIGENSFRISPILRSRNSFVPIITGRIQGDDGGSQIDIQMKMHPFVLFFMLVWLGMVGVVCLGILAEMVSLQRFEPGFFIPFGMFAFGCLLPFIGFKPEANRSKQFLIDLLSL